jgi:CRISPR/Cas system CSM-associated protein Csm3 (group 7 of RAMP superfamily)
MFIQQLNQIRLDLAITPRGPLLIRSGRQGADPTRPQLEYVRTRVDGEPSVYIPGSSLKGVMRAHAERLMRSEGLAITDTFLKDAHQAFRQKDPGVVTYANSCPLGRTFGNLHVKGHVSVSDHLPGVHSSPGSADRRKQLQRANDLEERNGVGIDRLLGSASGGALFDKELVVEGRFDGRILLRNVQLYQLGLVLLVLRDLDEGYVQLGSGTTRGHGFVSAKIRRLVIESRRGRVPAGELAGVGELMENGGGYKFFPGDRMPLPKGLDSKSKLLWDRIEVTPERLDDLAEELVAGPWTKFVEQAKEVKGWRA